jgi:hypothetical protein
MCCVPIQGIPETKTSTDSEKKADSGGKRLKPGRPEALDPDNGHREFPQGLPIYMIFLCFHVHNF